MYQNPGTDKALSDSQVDDLFYPGQPNGGRGENCAYIKDEVKGWFDTRCGPIERWCFCRVQKATSFKARGIQQYVLVESVDVTTMQDNFEIL